MNWPPSLAVRVGGDGRAHYQLEGSTHSMCGAVDRFDDEADIDPDREGCNECIGAWCALIQRYLKTTEEDLAEVDICAGCDELRSEHSLACPNDPGQVFWTQTTEGETMAHTITTDRDRDTLSLERMQQLLSRYSGTLSRIIGDHARKQIGQHRERIAYLERWGIDETESQIHLAVDELISGKGMRIERLKEQLELAEMLSQIDMLGFTESLRHHFERSKTEES